MPYVSKRVRQNQLTCGSILIGTMVMSIAAALIAHLMGLSGSEAEVVGFLATPIALALTAYLAHLYSLHRGAEEFSDSETIIRSSAHYENLIDELDQDIGSEPENATAYFHRGRAYYHLGDYKRAIADFNAALDLGYPRNMQFLMARGITYLRNHDYQQAVAHFTLAVELNPRRAGTYLLRGYTRFHIGEYDRAFADFTKTIAFNSNSLVSRFFRGKIYLRRSNYDKAIADFSFIIRTGAATADVYYWRANAYLHKRNVSAVFEDYSSALDLDPDHPKADLMREFKMKFLARYALSQTRNDF